MSHLGSRFTPLNGEHADALEFHQGCRKVL
jgi:hypothetical protein